MRSGKRRNVTELELATSSLMADRRACSRYPLELQMQYKLIRGRHTIYAGDSRTCNISSGGILFFATGEFFAPGTVAELSIAWPVLLNSTVPMKLLAFGKVVRSDARGTAVAVLRYEFRTQGVRSLFPLNMASASGQLARLK